MSEDKKFNPAVHIEKLPGKGGPKDYLPVAARVLWFREKFPPESGWGIDTTLVDGGYEKKFAVYRCEIFNPEGQLIASGHNVEDVKGFGDFMQKAETGAIGRALATLGFGTMAALDEGEVVDSPIDKKTSFKNAPPVPPSGDGPVMDLACSWQDCGQVCTPMQAKATKAQYQRVVCRDHVPEAAKAKIAGRPLN
jgi:hypothetical protein